MNYVPTTNLESSGQREIAGYHVPSAISKQRIAGGDNFTASLSDPTTREETQLTRQEGVTSTRLSTSRLVNNLHVQATVAFGQ